MVSAVSGAVVKRHHARLGMDGVDGGAVQLHRGCQVIQIAGLGLAVEVDRQQRHQIDLTLHPFGDLAGKARRVDGRGHLVADELAFVIVQIVAQMALARVLPCTE